MCLSALSFSYHPGPFFSHLHLPTLCFSLSIFHQSIFMFPFSFSSSSSLSSIPPSLDSISELDHVLSDISEDDVPNDDTATSTWDPPSYATIMSDQQFAVHEHLIQSPQTSYPITSTQTCSSGLLGAQESCQAETTAKAGIPNWKSWFSLRSVVKYFSFILCFLSVSGKNGNRCLSLTIFTELTKKLNMFTPTLAKKMSMSAGKLKILTVSAPECTVGGIQSTSRLHQIRNSLALKWSHFVTFCTGYVPTKFISLAPAVLWHPSHLHLPLIPSLTYPPLASSFSSRSSFSSLPLFSYVLTPFSFSHSNLTSSIHRYLLNPSPLLLPCLLVVFLLLVMLTASQSLVLALILATPLGLTLCYLENAVSCQRRAVSVLPLFYPETPNDRPEELSSSGFNMQASPLTPTHTLLPTRHHTHTSATWTQEMCDPAA